MSVSTETLHATSRAQLVDEIASLEAKAQAEADFAVVAIHGEKNPWCGAGAALALAREQLAALDEQERVASFKSAIAVYRERHARLREAQAKTTRIREIEAEQSALYMENRENLGNPHFSPPINVLAMYRTEKPTSPQDAKEREIAKAWKHLEDERARLETAIEQAKAQCTHLEEKNSYLVALGEQLDGEQR
jgi:predicted  nucleic acid-binding Zn-ribbon protein